MLIDLTQAVLVCWLCKCVSVFLCPCICTVTHTSVLLRAYPVKLCLVSVSLQWAFSLLNVCSGMTFTCAPVSILKLTSGYLFPAVCRQMLVPCHMFFLQDWIREKLCRFMRSLFAHCLWLYPGPCLGFTQSRCSAASHGAWMPNTMPSLTISSLSA